MEKSFSCWKRRIRMELSFIRISIHKGTWTLGWMRGESESYFLLDLLCNVLTNPMTGVGPVQNADLTIVSQILKHLAHCIIQHTETKLHHLPLTNPKQTHFWIVGIPVLRRRRGVFRVVLLSNLCTGEHSRLITLPCQKPTYLVSNVSNTMNILCHVPYVLPHPDTPTMQITNFTPSPNCISPPNPGTPRTDASRSSVLPGHTSTHHHMK